jgi:hypothetical protein
MFYGLVSLTRHPCFLKKEGRAQPSRPWLCLGCGTPKPGIMAVDVSLQDRAPRDKPLNLVWGGGVGLIHQDLIDCIGPEIVKRDLYLGRVTGDRGNEILEWSTFHGRRGVIIRGSKDARCRTCDQCSRPVYSAMGKRYLCPAPPENFTILESDIHGLVVPQDIYERIVVRKWRLLGIEKLPVLDEPLDGLGPLEWK